MRDSPAAIAKRRFHLAILMSFPECPLRVGSASHYEWLDFMSTWLEANLVPGGPVSLMGSGGPVSLKESGDSSEAGESWAGDNHQSF